MSLKKGLCPFFERRIMTKILLERFNIFSLLFSPPPRNILSRNIITMKFPSLCLPSKLYLGISLVCLLLLIWQNMGNTNLFCVGMLSCSVANTYLLFLAQLLYIIFWTFILNIICKSGYPWLSWLLLLLPFVLFALTVFSVMV